MRNEQTVKDIYKIAGMLEMMTCMQDHPLTSGMVAELADAVDKLELIGAALMDIDIDIIGNTQNSRLIDFFNGDEFKSHVMRHMQKVVTAHEGTEESPPETLQPDQ